MKSELRKILINLLNNISLFYNTLSGCNTFFLVVQSFWRSKSVDQHHHIKQLQWSCSRKPLNDTHTHTHIINCKHTTDQERNMGEGILKDKRRSPSGMTALVTGATRGIGHAIVEELAGFGASVHICSRKQEDIDKCLEEWKSKGFSVTGQVCDVSSHNQRQSLMETVASIFHRKLNILINNAGITDIKESVDHAAEDISSIMSTNFEGTYHLSQRAYPLLKASGYGSIVNISSVITKKVFLGASAYAASKGAINQITKYMAMEWAKDNIRVNAKASGPVMTLLLESFLEKSTIGENASDIFASQIPAGRIGEPKEISEMAVFLCLPAASYITGQVICVDGGFTL